MRRRKTGRKERGTPISDNEEEEEGQVERRYGLKNPPNKNILSPDYRVHEEMEDLDEES